MRTHTHVCGRTLMPCVRMLMACTRMCTELGFHKLCKESFLHFILVWNESYIIWEPPQTPIFRLYKAIKGTFSKEEEIVNQRESFSQNTLKSKFS